MAYSFGICTLGCKVNQYESECIRGLLENRGFVSMPFSAKCDVYIINSCTVTGESDRKVMQMCRRAVRTNPEAFVCVIGCMAQIAADRLAQIEGISYIGGNVSKGKVVDVIAAHFFPEEKSSTDAGKGGSGNASVPRTIGQIIDAEPFAVDQPYEPLCLSDVGHTRAVIKIEDGCDSACSYCIIHTARGPARSRGPEDVLSEIEQLAKAGYKEVILTGIELSSYSYDLPELLIQTGNISGIERIRLGSLDPAFITEERIHRFSQAEKLMPHFHISLQSGSSKILAKMRRKYNAQTAFKRVKYLKESFPGACLFADIIVGFPGETEEDFEETVNFIKEIPFLHLHIFPYSKRKGTPAAAMPDQVPDNIKRERAARLDSIQKEIKRKLLEEVVKSGKTLKVLFEANRTGHSEEFIEIKIAERSGCSCSADSACTGGRKISVKKGEIAECTPLYTDGDVIYVSINGQSDPPDIAD